MSLTPTRRLLFSWIPAALLLLVAEGVARLVGWGEAMQVGGPLGWTMQPSLSGYRVDQPDPQLDFVVDTNADGLRTSLPRAHGARPRVALVGESTIFGWAVSAEDAPAARLERALGGEWEALNGGQPGYSTLQAVRLGVRLLTTYHPDMLILFLAWNDLNPGQPDVASLPAHPTEALGGGLWARSALVRGLLQRRAAVLLRDRATINPLMPVRLDTVPSSRNLRVSETDRRAALATLCEPAARAGARLVVAVLPQGFREDASDPSPFVREGVDMATALGIPAISLDGALGGLPASLVNVPGDPAHFTPLANQVLMSRLAVELKARRLL